MKRLLVAAVVAACVIAGTEQARAAGGDAEEAGRMVERFAPWISAVIQQKSAVADRIFPLEKPAQAEVFSAEAVQIYSRFTHLDGTPLSLIGMRVLGDHMGTLLFTTATEHGPVAFKVYYYRYGTETHIGRVEIVGRWSEIEALVLTVDPLPQVATATLQAKVQ